MAAEIPHDIPSEAAPGSVPAGSVHRGRQLLAGTLLSWIGVLICWLLLHKNSGVVGRICPAGSGCDAVLSSRYSAMGGVPLSWVGLGFYLLLFCLLLVASGSAKVAWRKAALGTAWWLSIAGLTFSVLLMAVQFWVLRAFCPLCTASACVVVLLWAALAKAEAEFTTPGSRGTVLVMIGMALSSLTAAALTHGGVRSEIVAIVDGQKITRQQMEEDLAVALQPVAQQRHAMEVEWLRKKLDAILLEAEAQRVGTTPGQLLASTTDSLPPPTPEEIKARLSKRSLPYNPVNLAAVQEELVLEKREAARNAILNEIASRHSVQLFLPPPKVRALQIDLSTARTAGPTDAPARLVVFSDFQCQFCAQLAPVLQRIRAEFPKEVMVAFRYFPLEAHPRAVPAAVAAECAAEQGAFWAYHDRLFADGGDLSEGRLVALAVEAGLDEERFRQCLQSDRAAGIVETSRRDAAAAGLEGAPAVFLNGRRIEGSLDYPALVARLKAELKRVGERTRSGDR